VPDRSLLAVVYEDLLSDQLRLKFQMQHSEPFGHRML
jgi:hypothetical protein